MAVSNPLLVRLRLPREGARQLGGEKPAAQMASLASTLPARGCDTASERDNDASDSSASTGKRAASDSAASARTRRRKKTKPTYAVRKEEHAKLAAEMKRLEARVEELRARAGMPSRESLLAVEKQQQQTCALEHAWRSETLALCGVQSVVGNHLRAQHMSPLHTHMRLGRDLEERRRTLEAVRREKLDIGYRFLAERFRDVDDREPFCELQQWTTAQGDFCFRRADILVFEGVERVKKVFDALLFFFINMEISISEQLGQLTLRDDIDTVDTQIVSHRIMTSTDHGLEMEMNAVGFSEYYKTEDGEEVALLVTDTVDEDELHPYATGERVRKDIAGAITMKAFRELIHEGASEEHLVVAMKRCVFLSIIKPPFPITKAAREDLRTNIAIWGEVMATTMKEYLRV